MSLRSYSDLDVWKKSVALVIAVYGETRRYPSDERFGLTAQLRRAALSIPVNIAEGYGRASRKDYLNFLSNAKGSLYETETLIHIAGVARLLTTRGDRIAPSADRRQRANAHPIEKLAVALTYRQRTPATRAPQPLATRAPLTRNPHQRRARYPR